MRTERNVSSSTAARYGSRQPAPSAKRSVPTPSFQPKSPRVSLNLVNKHFTTVLLLWGTNIKAVGTQRTLCSEYCKFRHSET